MLVWYRVVKLQKTLPLRLNKAMEHLKYHASSFDSPVYGSDMYCMYVCIEFIVGAGTEGNQQCVCYSLRTSA